MAHEFGLSYLENDIWRPYRILWEIKVSCLTLAPTNRLWVGTANGIYAINSPDREPSIELPPVGHPPRAIAIASDNDIWLCNAQDVYHYQNSSWLRFSKSVQPHILTLAIQGQNLWLGTFRGLVRVDLTANEQYSIDTGRQSEVTALVSNSQGVWAACGGRVGLATEAGWASLGDKQLNTPITSLATVSDGEVWIGTHDGLYHGGREEICLHLTDTPPDVIDLPSRYKSPITFSNLVQALSVQNLTDRSVLWIGTVRGLFRVDLLTENWRRYGQFGTQDIRAIITSPDQETVWVASWSDGLHGLKKQNEPQSKSDISEPILAITVGNFQYWAVGFDGLYQHKGSVWEKVLSNQELSVRGWLQAVSQAVTDRVWLGTSTGLLSYTPDTKQLSTVSGHLRNADIRYVLAIRVDELELLLVGTSQGLYLGDSANWESVPDLENRTITALTLDSNANILWVGTDRGLFRLFIQDKNRKIDKFDVHNSGLAANRVIALAVSTGEIGETKLWVGTPCGLSCYTY